MIRVIYRWQVAPEHFAEFHNLWRQTTNHIHETVPGALGSFLLQSCETENEVITVAKWQSLADWQNFWGNQNPAEMQAMRKLGVRISAETFTEIEDHTR